MGQIVVNVGSFDLTSHNGNTAYSTVRYFDIPANAGITSCVATFATHVNTVGFQGKSFSLNGTQAHTNTPWPTSGIALNTALLSTGQNTFRGAVKSQADLSARWSIGDIYLTIDFNDVGGGGGTPPPNIGTITLDKSSMLAGETVTVSLSPCDNGIYRSIRVKWQGTLITSLIVGGDVPSGGTYTYTFTLDDCSRMPNDTSGSLTFEMETSVDITVTRTMIVQVPDSVVPTIGAVTALRDANGVDWSITNYVQNYSKCYLEVLNQAGALGSVIAAVEITGGGFSAAASTASFGPFSQTGDITFTAKVTDTRGRTATKAVTINVLAYTPVSGVNLLAYRSNGSMISDDEGAYATIRGRRVFSSLDGQNAGTIKGRVYEKDTTPGGWTTMSDDTLLLLGGSMSIEKGYTAEIYINDKITAVVYVFQIPTAIVGIHITPGATGGGFGMYGQPNRWDFHKPVYANDIILTSSPNPNLLHNWDFLNPVNQRGVSGLISSGSYFIDRWIRLWGQMVVNAGYLTIVEGSELGQKIENPALSGAAVTASIKVGGVVYSASGAFPSTSGVRNDIALTGFGEIRIGIDSSGVPYFSIVSYAERHVQAVKLELGTVSTLHLDPPMDHAVELPKCRRFYRPLLLGSGRLFNFTSSVVELAWDLDPPMRIVPTAYIPSLTDAILVQGVGLYTPTSYIPWEDNKNSLFALKFTGTYGGEGPATFLYAQNCFLSAEL